MNKEEKIYNPQKIPSCISKITKVCDYIVQKSFSLKDTSLQCVDSSAGG